MATKGSKHKHEGRMESDIFLAKVKCDEGGMGMYITGKDDLSRKLAKAF